MEKKTFLNFNNLYNALEDVFTKALEDMEGGDAYERMIDEYARFHTEKIMKDMEKYVHQKDTSLSGNSADIRQDWDDVPQFVKSNVTPWGNFRDVVASVDNGTISDTDLAKLQEWVLDWFFTAFGTWGLTYNFQNEVADQMYVDEMESETE